MEESVKIDNLSKVFYPVRSLSEAIRRPFSNNRSILVLDKISFNVKQGEIFGIVGPNGAGKTTLIKILCGLIIPTSGDAFIKGFHVVRDIGKLKKNIGFVSGNERSFYWRLTCRQNLDFFAALYNVSGIKRKEKINYLSELLEFTQYLDRQFQECSAGIKQRLALARALLNEPNVIFMDEPTKSLDPVAASELRDFARKTLSKDKTIVFSSHNLDEVAKLADRIAVMDRGAIKACGSPESLRKAINNPELSLEEIFRYYVSS